jgi:hypothetical protein
MSYSYHRDPEDTRSSGKQIVAGLSLAYGAPAFALGYGYIVKSYL